MRLYEVLEAVLRLVQERGEDACSPSRARRGSVAADQFKRMAFRALDYLPPGEVSFADYGRAVIAADQASHPADRGLNAAGSWDEFKLVHIVPKCERVEGPRQIFASPRSRGTGSLATLVESDWAAYEFANTNRKLLGIPPGHPLPRPPTARQPRRSYYRGGGAVDATEEIRECIFKVSW